MSKKIFSIFLISSFYILASPFPTHAFNLFDFLRPAQVNKSLRTPPKEQSKDRYDKTPDFNTNDPQKDTVDICSLQTSISRAFDPDCTETEVKNSDGTTSTQKTCRKYYADKIESNYSDQQNYNRAPAILHAYFSNEPKNITVSGKDKEKSFLSLDVSDSLSASERITTYREQLCLKGRRLYQALDSLDPTDYTANNFTVDVQVALDCGGKVTNVPEGNCRPIPLSEIVYYLRPQLFDPQKPCTDDTQPIPYPSKLNGYLSKVYESDSSPLSYVKRYGVKVSPLGDYQTLYLNLTLTDANAISALETITSVELGGTRKPTPKPRNIARLGVANPNTDDILRHLVPQKQKLITLDPCALGNSDDSYDGSNTLTWEPLFYRDLLKEKIEIFEDAITVSKSLDTSYKIPTQVNSTFSLATTFAYLMTPHQNQKDVGFDNFADNSGSRFPDQGNKFRQIYETTFWKQFYPLSEQNL